MAHIFKDGERTKDVMLDQNVNFESLMLPKEIMNGLKAGGFRKPSPIQLKAIPVGRCGFDLIVRSKSGTGKTLVFGTLALEMIDTSRNNLQVLILAPTREIAVQIQDVIKGLGIEYKDLKVESFIGGLPLDQDIAKLQSCHIAVGAPGRVKHLIEKKTLQTDDIQLFVLDEADKLMEATFQSDINQIYHKLPDRKQMIAVSATFPNELDQFLAKYMQCPTYVSSENETAVLLGLKQFAVVVKTFLNAAQQTRFKNDELHNILSKVPFTQCLIFTNYQTLAESISNILNQKGWSSTYISAAQKQSKRLEAVNTLKNFGCRILLSTDLTARGIDAANVDLVINYGMPRDAVTYLHRMGRAGRYGSKGTCITLCNDGKELKELQNILGVIGGTEMSVVRLPDGEMLPTDLENCDFSSFERVHGTLSQNTSKETFSEEVRSSVWSIKHGKHEKTKPEECLAENGLGSCNGALEINPESIKSVLEESKNKEENLNEQLTNLDLFSLLQSIAGEKTDDIKEEKAEELPSTSETERKKRKRRQKPNKMTTESKTILDVEKQQKTLAKNIALLNITKLLTSDCKTELPEIAESIASFSETIKMEDEYRINKRLQDNLDTKELLKQLVDKPESTLNNEESDMDEEEARKTKDENVIQNIFGLAFDYACGLNKTHWLQHLSKSEQGQFEEFCRDPETESSESEDEAMDFSEYACDEEEYVEVDHEPSGYENVNRNEQVSSNAWGYNHHSRPESVTNVESAGATFRAPSGGGVNNPSYGELDLRARDVSLNEQFVEYFRPAFEECSTNLWNTGATFENANNFNSWFAQWREQVRSVREYVQQNVYVQEMSAYQQNKFNG